MYTKAHDLKMCQKCVILVFLLNTPFLLYWQYLGLKGQVGRNAKFTLNALAVLAGILNSTGQADNRWKLP